MMFYLSQEIEALALRLASAKCLSVEDAIRTALEGKARAEGIDPELPRTRQQSAEAVAERQARTDKFLASLDEMPVRDPRSPREIMDDLNAL